MLVNFLLRCPVLSSRSNQASLLSVMVKMIGLKRQPDDRDLVVWLCISAELYFAQAPALRFNCQGFLWIDSRFAKYGHANRFVIHWWDCTSKNYAFTRHCSNKLLLASLIDLSSKFIASPAAMLIIAVITIVKYRVRFSYGWLVSVLCDIGKPVKLVEIINPFLDSFLASVGRYYAGPDLFPI